MLSDRRTDTGWRTEPAPLAMRHPKLYTSARQSYGLPASTSGAVKPSAPHTSLREGRAGGSSAARSKPPSFTSWSPAWQCRGEGGGQCKLKGHWGAPPINCLASQHRPERQRILGSFRDKLDQTLCWDLWEMVRYPVQLDHLGNGWAVGTAFFGWPKLSCTQLRRGRQTGMLAVT